MGAFVYVGLWLLWLIWEVALFEKIIRHIRR
jgi:hypothetical protein